MLTFCAASFAVVLAPVVTFCLEDVLFVDVAFAFAKTFFFAGAFLTAVLGLATLTEAFAEAVFELSFAVLEETFFAEGVLDFTELTFGLLSALLDEVLDLALALEILAFLVAGIT